MAAAGPTPVAPRQQSSGPLAPGWHFAVVLLLLLGIAAIAAWSVARAPDVELTSRARMLNYATLLVWEWVMVAFIAWGLRRNGHRLSELIEGRWATAGAFGRDLGISVLFLLGSGAILGSIRWALRDTTGKAIRGLLPSTPAEMVLWVALAATAGFCEETIFRGYLQKQITRMTRSKTAGLVLQAVVFGACHGYQGMKPMFTISIFGLLFGLLANYVQNLRPGMLAHFLQDTTVGLAGRALLKRIPAG